MTTSVTTHSTSVLVSMKGSISSHASDTSCDTSPMPSHTSRSMLSSPVSMTGMSGLLNSRNLVQDEKLVVATLATLDSGNPSNLIKQDLKWIIQSRRKAEGKAELQVEFKKPVKEEQLTLEELTKRARRRELNRLAARRSREKGQKRKDMLVEEIRKLQTQNSELFSILGGLTEQRNRIIDTLRQHMKQCSDYQATQNAAVGMSQRVLEMLGFPISSSMHQDLPGVSSLYISTGGEHSCSPPQCSSPPVVIKDEHYSPFTSCQMSPLVVGLSGKVIQADSVAVKPSPKSSVKIEESPPVLSSCAYQTFGSSPSPQLSSSQSVSFDSPLLPAPRSAIPKRRSSMHGGEESVEDEEFFQYKHKLMKHRKQSSTDPPKVPSSETSSSSFSIRSTRVTLERSFSFPCSSSETRSNLDSPLQSSFTSDNLAVEPTATYKYYEVLPTPVPSLHTGSKSYTTDSPLDLVVKKTSETSSDFEKHFRIGQTDTWPPAGSRFGGTARGIERRWSVDDHSSFPEPLNLSKEVSTDDDGDLSQMSSFSSSSQHLSKTSSKYSSHSVDPFR